MENPVVTATAAYPSGEIDIDGVDVVEAVKLTVLETAGDAGTILGLFKPG